MKPALVREEGIQRGQKTGLEKAQEIITSIFLPCSTVFSAFHLLQDRWSGIQSVLNELDWGNYFKMSVPNGILQRNLWSQHEFLI